MADEVARAKAQAKADKAKAKETKAADRARKKASTDPADMNRFKQVAYAYKLTRQYDKPLPWLLLGAFLVPTLIGLGVGIWLGFPVMIAITGMLCGVLAAMLLLGQRARKATYKRYEGQAGSAEIALQMLPKQWISSPVIAVTKQKDAVHRSVGPGGVVLIGEGEPGRIKALLASEVKKHEKVAYGIPVTTVVMGDKPGQVPLTKLTDYIKKLPKVLEPHQVTDVKQRLRALDAVRPQVPIPKGPMPTSARQVRGAQRAMRGR